MVLTPHFILIGYSAKNPEWSELGLGLVFTVPSTWYILTILSKLAQGLNRPHNLGTLVFFSAPTHERNDALHFPIIPCILLKMVRAAGTGRACGRADAEHDPHFHQEGHHDISADKGELNRGLHSVIFAEHPLH